MSEKDVITMIPFGPQSCNAIMQSKKERYHHNTILYKDMTPFLIFVEKNCLYNMLNYHVTVI